MVGGGFGMPCGGCCNQLKVFGVVGSHFPGTIGCGLMVSAGLKVSKIGGGRCCCPWFVGRGVMASVGVAPPIAAGGAFTVIG